jgi:preprotein translocase subunit SecG
MATVLIVIHLMVVLAMIGLVLLQRSEGGALGIGGGSGAFLTGRGATNVLTRTTAILAAAFFVTSIGLTILARLESRPSDILERLPAQPAAGAQPQAPAPPAGEPSSAEDLLRQLGGTEPGPQTPPADGVQTPQPGEGDAAPAAPAAPAPAERPQ